MLLSSAPESMLDAMTLVQTSSRSHREPRRPITMRKFIGKQRPESDAPFSEGLVVDLDTVLVKQFLNITAAERQVVVPLDSVPDEGHP